LVCMAFVVLVLLGIKAVRYAKGGSSGAHVLGAVLILMGFGNMQDPTMEMVARAKEQRRSDEDDSGDPPGPQGEDNALG
jgi:hypothetical protein